MCNEGWLVCSCEGLDSFYFCRWYVHYLLGISVLCLGIFVSPIQILISRIMLDTDKTELS